MNTAVATTPPQPPAPAHAIMERVLMVGDLSKLTPQERVEYYNAVCASLGLNPLTRPFAYTNLSGSLVLYARKDAAEQLRKINGISVSLKERKIEDGVCIVTAHAKHESTGRTDEEIGAVSVGQLKGEFLANGLMKAVTKAKRRVTLSICGLGFPDQDDVEDARRVRHREPVDHTRPKPRPAIPVADEIDEVAEDLRAAEERLDARSPQPGDRPGEDVVARERDAVEVAQRFVLTRITGEVVDATDFENWYLKMAAAIKRYEGTDLRKLMTLNHRIAQELSAAWPDEIDHLRNLAEQKLGAGDAGA